MKRSMRVLLALTLATTPILYSCAEANDPMGPDVTVTDPQNGLIGDLLGVVTGLLGILGGPGSYADDASEWIGPQGGTFTTGAYTLIVPKGAVPTSTLFSIEPTNNGQYSVELRAQRKALLGLLGMVDVGEQGFAKPVHVRMSYAKAIGVSDPRKLVIVYVTESGRLQPQPSTIDTSKKTVTGRLEHFSKYAMAQN